MNGILHGVYIVHCIFQLWSSWQYGCICIIIHVVHDSAAIILRCSRQFHNSYPSNVLFLCFQNTFLHLLFRITWKRCTPQCNFIDRIFLMINRFPRNTHLIDPFHRDTATQNEWDIAWSLHSALHGCSECSCESKRRELSAACTFILVFQFLQLLELELIQNIVCINRPINSW